MKQSLAFLWLALAVVCSSCSDVETRTQLTFTIDAAATLREQLQSLQVVVRSDQGTDQPREFEQGELHWPVDIVVLPAQGNDSDYDITLFVRAYGAQRKLLADQRISGTFQAGRLRVVQVMLGAVNPPPDSDGGPIKDAGKLDASTPVLEQDSGPTPVDPGPPDSGTMMLPTEPVDAGNAVVNCAFPRSGITCDDGNVCNGKESCDPGNSSANSQGCIAGTDGITCEADEVCDRALRKCSKCGVKPDGDNDGVNATVCGGKDCSDNDDKVAPGKEEACDGKDNDCDGVVDGAKANEWCLKGAPPKSTSKCEASRCVDTCTEPGYQADSTTRTCVQLPVSCPIVNPCAPGTCLAGVGTYSCKCPSGYRAGLGMTRCAPIGEPMRKIGFETGCNDVPTPGLFEAEYKALSATLYAGACGVSSITSTTLMAAPQLFQPLPTSTVVGVTGTVALASPLSAAPVDVSIDFLPGVHALSFDVLDLDSPAGVQMVLKAGGAALPAQALVPALGSKKVQVMRTSATPIERVTLTYTPISASDGFFIDELAFRVAGCGDKVVDMMAGETCDDGNAEQCDGCDNACASAPTSCPAM